MGRVSHIMCREGPDDLFGPEQVFGLLQKIQVNRRALKIVTHSVFVPTRYCKKD